MAKANSRIRFTALAALGAAGAVLFFLTPPAPQRLDASEWSALAARTAAGAYHVHTSRSDGHADRHHIASAAARAGLRFVIFTDHGDGTRPPDPPAYVDGVLLLDAVEISTANGHVAAIDMPRAPYPLGGSGDAVVEDIQRLGGFAIAAHPDSPKPALRWTSDAPVDGIEWINLDSEWRDDSRTTLLRAGLAYFVRPAPGLATLLDRPVTLDRWSAMSRDRAVVALAAVDAHGGPGGRAEDQSRNLFGTIGIPSYEASFRLMSNRVVLDAPLSGDAASDARAVYDAIRQGRVFSSIDALAGPALLDFSATAGGASAVMGGSLPPAPDAALSLSVLAPPGSEIAIVPEKRGQSPFFVTAQAGKRGQSPFRQGVGGEAGGYRVEVRTAGAPGTPPVPWLVSNAIRFEAARPSVTAPAPAAPTATTIAPFPWRIEKDDSSSAMVRTTASDATLEYKLGAGERTGQFVALATDLGKAAFSAIDLTLSGDRPQRVSVQLRAADGRRWGRSYYVDPGGSTLSVPVDALRPADPANPARIESTGATSLLLVVDLTNASPGRAGRLRVLSSAFR